MTKYTVGTMAEMINEIKSVEKGVMLKGNKSATERIIEKIVNKIPNVNKST